MQTRIASVLAWGLWGLSLALAGLGLWLVRANEGGLGDDLFIVPVVAGIEGVGALIASRRSANAIGWMLVAAGTGTVVGFVSGEFARYLALHGGSVAAAEYIGWISEWVWLPTFGLIPTYLILLFPDGRLPSARWRPVAWFVGITIAVGTLGPALQPGMFELEGVRLRNPFGIESLDLSSLEDVFFPIFVVGIVLCFAGLVVRFRRSRGDERQQIRWFLRAALLAVVAHVLAVGDLLPSLLGDIVFWLGIGSLGAALAVGVLKYRLYEIDLVVRKTLIYGLLAAVVTALYLLLVVAIPAAVLGTSVRGESLVMIAGTAALTLALLPLRRRATHLVNRLVYGKRATPYEVMSEFAERLGGSYSMDDVLPRMARILAEGTGAERADVLLGSDETRRPAARWPAGAGDGPPDLLVPVVHRGQELGALAVRKPRGEPLTPAEEKLVRDLAAQAGLVLRNVRLLEDVRASRSRLVAAQDTERRRLERDIHDGAQQHLVSLMVRLRLAEGLMRKDPEKAASALADAKDQAGEALETLRDLARGIYPPLLADQGLAAALAAAAGKAPVPVEVHPDGVGRYPAATEAAVYFCILEALQNVAKYAGATRAHLTLRQNGRELEFEVRDDGRGFDPATTPAGSGLQNMQDRVAALGGSLEIRSEPGAGTTVVGRIPAEAAS